MATRLGSLFVTLTLGLSVAGATGQTILVPAAPVLVPAVLVDGAGELIRVFEEGKDAAEKVDPPEISLGPAFEPPAEYR
jgi:hypothetical protein